MSTNATLTKLRAVTNFPSLVNYLRDELEWQFDDIEDVEDALYEYDATDFGLDAKHSARIQAIKQIVPFVSNQPWGIFWLDFGAQKPSVMAMRGLLRGLVRRKRASANEADRQRFALENLLFILTSEDFNRFDFAYFRGGETARAQLAIFGWRKGETHLRTLCEYNLPKLKFPADASNTEGWLRNWREAFDVEKVTENFFAGYKAVFSRLEASLKTSIADRKSGDKEAQETRRIFAQRLFNRLMFIYFLQKKGWLSFKGDKNYLQTLFAESERNGENFFRQRLYWLFFHGLSFAGKAHESEAKGELVKLIDDVPYLNGGLFEIEDDLDVRGRVDIQNEMFADILDFFSKYNFTVEESTPLDVQVAVDPEMLGKIFEKVITERESEKSERKSKGRYYTPRYVVSFMYREALKHFLAETNVAAQKIKELVDHHRADEITVPEAEILLDKLDKLRIVDPACGSGAYLLGCLQELFAVRRKLDPLSRKATPRDDYHRKLRIIQQNIYGVDLDDFAVQVARLRLWLSLVVDYEGPVPEPLPNLDFKIERGDSLAAPNPRQASLSGMKSEIDRYRKAKADYFAASVTHPDDLEYKRRLLDEAKELREQIAFWIHTNRNARTAANAFDWAIEFAEIFLADGFDIVLANPPYGAESNDKTLRENFFGRGTTQSKDTYGLFIARGLELLRPNGTLCYIVSDTWRTIKSHKPLRRRILDETTVKHFVDLPSWIFDATVNTNIVTLTKTPADPNHMVVAGDLHNLPNKDWDTLYRNLEAVAEHGFDAQTLIYARYTYPQSLISTYDNLSFFVASPKLYRLMSDPRFQKLSAVADVRVGLQTGDNEFYLRKRAGVRGSYAVLDETKLLTEAEITSLTDDEKRNGVDPSQHGGRHFLQYDKGGESDSASGWLPNYHVPTGYFIDWAKASVNRLRTATSADVKRRKGKVNEIKPSDNNSIASRFQNREFYFREGVTFSRTGAYAPTYRLNSSSVFDTEGSAIFSDTFLPRTLLGLLSSVFSRYIIKNFVDHTVHAQIEDIKEFILLELPEEKETQLISLVESIIEKQKSNQLYPYHLHEQKEIDQIVYELYGLTPEDIQEVEIWYCRRYDKLARAQGFVAEVEARYTPYLQHCDIVLAKPPSYWNAHPIKKLIAQGEGQMLDFKQFFGMSKSGMNQAIVRDDNATKSTLKTLASFLNAEGGTILIGVNDESLEITGINPDLSILRGKTENEFKEKIQNLIKSRFTPEPTNLITISFEHLAEGVVCRIDAKQSYGKPIYFDNKLYVRNGIRGDEKIGHELTMWIQERTSA